MTIRFPDVSQYTPNVDPAAYPILIARATLSDRVADSTYTTFKAKAAAAGTLFVAYHWLNHGNLAAQAQWAYQHVGPGVPLMIDAEDKAGNTGYAGPLTVDDLIGFATAYRTLGGTVSLAYVPAWYWSGAMSAPSLRPLTAAGLGLVSSNYPAAGYTETGPGWAPYGGVAPVQWQYTSTPIDMNAYRGTVAEYAAMVGGDMSDSWTEPLTQGTPGYAGQQRDTALAFAWQAAHDAKANTDAIIAKLDAPPMPAPVALSDADRDAIAAAVAAQLGGKLDQLLTRLAAAAKALEG